MLSADMFSCRPDADRFSGLCNRGRWGVQSRKGLLPPERVLCLLIVSLAVLGGCDRQSQRQQDVYVWQRIWTPAVVDAVQQASPHVERFRLLSAQWRVGDEPVVVDLSPGQAAFDNQQVVPVVRLDGTRLSVTPAEVAAVLDAQITMLQAAGASVVAVEIDHDTATAAVGDYADWLTGLRAALPDELPLWITALPDWRHSPDIARLLDGVDAYTLQVHAVSDNGAKLMDTELALDWVRDFGRLSRTDLYIALPTYQLRAGLDQVGELMFLEGEATVAATAAVERNLFVPPSEVVEWVSRVSQGKPRWLVGLAWFRLPIAGDRTVIGMETFLEMTRGRLPEARIESRIEPTAAGARSFDVSLINHGPHDEAWPALTELPAGCIRGDGVNGFEFDARIGQFTHEHPGLLRVGQALQVGWVHCEVIDHAEL